MTIPLSLAAIEARVTTLMCKGKNSLNVGQWGSTNNSRHDISGMTNATKEQMFAYIYKTILTVMNQTLFLIDKFHRVFINNL